MNLIKQHIQKMSPYHPPLEGRDPRQHLLLDFNERTTPVAQVIREAVLRQLEDIGLQVYPSYGNICQKLAEYAGVSKTQVMITNGSDQGIDMVFRSVCAAGDEVIIPTPSFAMFFQSAQVEGLKILSPSYGVDGSYPLEEVRNQITAKTKCVVVCNPNNPTASLLPRDEVLRLAADNPAVAILVDECYFEYAKVSVVDKVSAYPNLFVTRTFSKTWGLPSLRFGYLIADEENIEHLLKVRGPYDINTLAVAAASAALDNLEYMESFVQEVLTKSKPKLESYLKEKGIRFLESSANFILFFPPSQDNVVETLSSAGILVRPRKGPNIEGSVRVTLGTLEQTEKLISALEEVL